MIIDFSTSRPSVKELKAAGVTSVGRYLGWDGVSGYPNTGKNITKSEANGYTSNGISVFLAFEYLASAAALGTDQGARDGALATEQLAQISAPVNAGVYFAVDYDIPDYDPGLANTPANARAKLGPIGNYFAEINNLKPKYRVGVYGGYWAVKRILDAGLATLGWQTVAWSGGNVDSRAVLLQTTGRAPFSGTDINIHEGKADDWGQWPAPAGPKPPVTPPTAGKYEVQVERYKDGFGWVLEVSAQTDPGSRYRARVSNGAWSNWTEFTV
jgi:hypothetical protein